MFKENKFAPIFCYKRVIPNKTKHASQLLKTTLLVINAYPSRIYACTHTHLHLYLCIFPSVGFASFLKSLLLNLILFWLDFTHMS